MTKPRPFEKLGYGSGWKKDTGLTVAQQWKMHERSSAMNRRLDDRVAKMRKGHELQEQLWTMQDTRDCKSSMAMAKSLARQTEYLQKQERELKQRLDHEAARAQGCRSVHWAEDRPWTNHLPCMGLR